MNCLVKMIRAHACAGISKSVMKRSLANAAADKWNFKTLDVSFPKSFVAHVQLNRPDKGNAMNDDFWREMRECFAALDADEDVRSIVLSGKGKIFTGGLDLESIGGALGIFDGDIDPARRAKMLRKVIQSYQQSFTQIEDCNKPVIAAIHSACIGGGVDMVTACDVRFCTEDAYFQVKEVDLGLAADVGTLQRLPKITGNDSFVREICYTARKVYSQEALKMGLISRILPNKENVIDAAMDTASLIAEKSPVAVQTTKESLVYSKDHPVKDSLNHMTLLNQLMLQSEDLIKSAEGMMTKKTAIYSKL